MEKRRRPRALTLTLPHGKQPYLMLEGRKYTLRNFSEEGIGLWIPSPLPFGLNKGAKISGDIIIDSHIYPVSLAVMRVDERMAGLKIVHQSKELAAIFKKLLAPADYANSLTLHESAGKQDTEFGYSLLRLTGGPGVEVLIWYNELQNMIMGIQLIWLGKWVYRHQFQPAETGFLDDEAEAPFGRRLTEEDLFIKHESADPELLAEACHFLSCITQMLPGHLLWQFLETGEQVYLPSVPVPSTGTDG